MEATSTSQEPKALTACTLMCNVRGVRQLHITVLL